MTTNYIFGNGRISTMPKSPGLNVNLSPTTTAAINNTSPISQAVAPKQTTLPMDNPTSSIASNSNSAIDSFDNQINQLTMAKVNRDRQEQQQAQQQAQQSVDNTGGVSLVDNVKYSGPASGARAQLVSAATSLIGEPYAWGGGGYGVKGSLGALNNGGPTAPRVVGVDCSGLTTYAYSTLGIRLPHQSDTQLRTSGYKTAVKNLQAGDLIGWSAGGHVAMYDGNGGIIESVAGGPRRRKLTANDFARGVYGVHISLPGD